MLLTHEIVQPFVNMLEEAMPYQVTITNTEGYIIGSSDLARLDQFHPSAYEILCGRKPVESWDLETNSYVNVPEGVQLGYGERIIYDGDCIGLIGIVGAPEEIKQSLKTAQLVLHLMLDRKKASDELKLIARDKYAFVQRLLRGQCGSKEWTRERAETYGIELSIPRWVLVVQTNLFSFEEKGPLELSTIRQRVNRTVRALYTGQKDLVYEGDTGEIVVLTASEGHRNDQRRKRIMEKSVTQLYTELKRLYKISVLIGVSEECADYTEIPRALNQARAAAEIGARTEQEDGIYYYAQMRLGRIVADFSLEVRPILEKEIIEKLLDANESGLIETLRVYFEHNASVTETAQELFIHRNTLQYRFRQIREITGFDIHNVDDLVQLRLAILQYRYFRNGRSEHI